MEGLTTAQTQKEDILCLSPAALSEALKEMGQPAYRAKQLFSWVHKQQAASFDEMDNLPKALRAQLSQRFHLAPFEILRKQVSQDGTVKYLFALDDANAIETVVMRYRQGNSICISTQVGCRMGCTFCASTKNGLVRNLTAGEMLSQIYTAQRDLGEKMSSLVLMGIGEPLDNFENVVSFLRLLSEPEGFALGQRNVSLSTCGLVPGIDALAKEKFGLTLSVSLHAPFNEMRSGMMPVNNAYNIDEVIAACKRYQKATGRRISFEYTLIKGVNDTRACALELAALTQGFVSHVNLIPLNTVEGTGLSASEVNDIQKFENLLKEKGVTVTVRRRLGQDISAACGQLRTENAAN